jgi:hypothetical protein
METPKKPTAGASEFLLLSLASARIDSSINRGAVQLIVVSDLIRGRSRRENLTSLKWQRLEPYEKFAAMIDHQLGRHRGLLPTREQSFARLRRGAQQEDSGDPAPRLRLHNEDYLRLKILTCMLPAFSGFGHPNHRSLCTVEQSAGAPVHHKSTARAASNAVDMMERKRVAHIW